MAGGRKRILSSFPLSSALPWCSPLGSLLVMLSKSDPTSNAEGKVTEARTKTGEGHSAKTQVSQETLRPESSMNTS